MLYSAVLDEIPLGGDLVLTELKPSKIPTVREELRQQIQPGELTVDGAPMPEGPRT